MVGRLLKRSGGGRSRSKSTRGRVRLYFGSGNNSGGRCYDNGSEVECERGSSTVGIIIGSVILCICIAICACYIQKNCCKKSSSNTAVAHFKRKDTVQAEVDEILRAGTMKAKPGQTDWTKTNSFPMTPIAPSPAPVPFPEETQNVQPTMAKQ